jgi:5-methylcytosine-specific restriction endonuclease McrA
MSISCILLNGDYTFLCLIDWKKAMKLVLAEKVKVLKHSDKVIRGVGKVFKAPAVLVLIKVVRAVYRGRVPFGRKNVLIRDRFTCAYCGKSNKSLTIDHVIPRLKGGKTDFDNCVACCKDCNIKKGSRAPREAGVRLINRPYQPTISEFIRIRLQQSGVYKFLVEIGIY